MHAFELGCPELLYLDSDKIASHNNQLQYYREYEMSFAGSFLSETPPFGIHVSIGSSCIRLYNVLVDKEMPIARGLENVVALFSHSLFA